MKRYFQIVFLTFFCLGFYCNSYSQSKSPSNIERELKNVLEEWVQNANKKNFDAMSNLLTEDYCLFQLGKRRNKEETITMIRGSGLSDITYEISNERSESSGTIAF